MKLINFMQHQLTTEQIEGLFAFWGEDLEIVHLKDIDGLAWSEVQNSPDDKLLLELLVHRIFNAVGKWDEDAETFVINHDKVAFVLPGGSPAFNAVLQRELMYWEGAQKVKCCFAHSERESVEKARPDGSIEKVAVFRHRKWIVI